MAAPTQPLAVEVDAHDVARLRALLGRIPAGSTLADLKAMRMAEFDAAAFSSLIDCLEASIESNTEVLQALSEDRSRLLALESDLAAVRRVFEGVV